MLRPISPELVLFLDFWVSNIPRYFCFCFETKLLLWWMFICIFCQIHIFLHFVTYKDTFGGEILTDMMSVMIRRKTFLFLLCFLLLLRSADYVGRPFCFCCVSYYFYYYSFLFFSTANFLQRFLRHFSTDLDQIWHVDSPWEGDLYVLISSQ